MIKFAFAALTGLALSTAVTAAQAKDPAKGADSAEATTPATAPKAERKYCLVDTVTGTRIPKKICKTRSEWQKENGFDPLNP